MELSTVVIAGLAKSLVTLPAFFVTFIPALLIVLLAMWLYVKITPYNEFELISNGNTAAAVSLGGMLLGFSIPIASLMLHAVGLTDFLIWSVVAFLAQILSYHLVTLFMGRCIKECMENGKVSIGLYLAATSVMIGILNAAALVYEKAP